MIDPYGNVVQLMDENGKVIKTYEYDSFGNEVKLDRKDENPFRYCGEYYDKETEEVYLRARYYQLRMGRFLTRDTYTGEEDEPLSLHLYTYCENDGVNRVAPSGHNSYVITINQFKGEAEGITRIATLVYKTFVELKTVNSKKSFAKVWNNMKTGKSNKIDCVVIDCHADTFSFADKGGVKTILGSVKK